MRIAAWIWLLCFAACTSRALPADAPLDDDAGVMPDTCESPAAAEALSCAEPRPTNPLPCGEVRRFHRGEVGTVGDLAADRDGALHHVWTGLGGELRYARCDRDCGDPSHWTETTLPASGFAALALGPDAEVHVLAKGGEYLSCSARCTEASRWRSFNLDDAEWAALAVGPDASVHAASPELYATCRRACTEAGSWSYGKFGGDDEAQRRLSVDEQGTVHFAQVESGDTGDCDADLSGYGRCERDCTSPDPWRRSTWPAPRTWDAPWIGAQRLLAVGTDVAVVRAQDDGLVFRRCSDGCADCRWSDPVVIPSARATEDFEVRADSGAAPTLVFSDDWGRGLRVVRCLGDCSDPCGWWADAVALDEYVAPSANIALAISDAELHVTYQDAPEGEIRHASLPAGQI